MNKMESTNSSKFRSRHIIVAALFAGLIGVITSCANVKTTVSFPNTSVPTSTTLPATEVTPIATTNPAHLQMQQIEINLLQNSGFENGFSKWTYLDNIAGLSVYETRGVNGKGVCSRQYLPSGFGRDEIAEFVQKEWSGFIQEVPIDPNQRYFFSAWVKLNKAVNVYAMAQYYNSSNEVGWALASEPMGKLPDGETSNGWFLVYSEMPMIPPNTNRALVGFWHGVINGAPNKVDSAFCIDDLVFGEIIK